ncbi:MAG: hypothetical protein GX488_00165 [Clostridiales bacterium]|nr:hypothetical protein [Clostridiales bacterium]
MKKTLKRSSDKRSAPPFRIRLGGGFMLFFALVYFFDDKGLIAALFPAVLVHEFGHIIALRLFRAYPTKLNATLSGFALDYSGSLSEKQEMLAALAGPAFGLIFTFICAKMGAYWCSDYLLMCSGLSFLLNIFNLLPAKPLDGGRILNFALISAFGSASAHKVIKYAGLITSAALISGGLFLIAKGCGFSLFTAGIWLFILQRKNSCKYS